MTDVRWLVPPMAGARETERTGAAAAPNANG